MIKKNTHGDKSMILAPQRKQTHTDFKMSIFTPLCTSYSGIYTFPSC